MCFEFWFGEAAALQQPPLVRPCASVSGAVPSNSMSTCVQTNWAHALLLLTLIRQQKTEKKHQIIFVFISCGSRQQEFHSNPPPPTRNRELYIIEFA